MRLLWFYLIFAGVGLSTLGAEPLYQERYRPRFHFTADKGYLNDPNGLFYLDGTYHLFFQHDHPFHKKKWGHATSRDLLHWTQHKDAITPVAGRGVFSGSAAIDYQNTTGFGAKENPPVVAVFTDWGVGQALAYSTDKGKTWLRYKGNPVLKLKGDEKSSFTYSARDPHIMWDEKKSRWILILYHNLKQEKRNEGEHKHRKGFSIFTSSDMKDWTYRSHLDGFYVCPDVFQLKTAAGKKHWLAMDWENYTTGNFDGETFTPDYPPIALDQGANLSANQSWKHLPDGRTIQICWIRDGKYPKMPFVQQMSFPTELSLREIGGRPRLCKQPIREIESLFAKSHRPSNLGLPLSLVTTAESLCIDLTVSVGKGEKLALDLLGQRVFIGHDRIQALGKTGTIGEPIKDLRILADVTTVEIFANRGAISMTYHLVPPEKPQVVKISAVSGDPKVQAAVAHEVKSTWK